MRFALIGAGGYVAPRHMEAIKAIGGDLVAIVDPHDSIGVIDRYFPDCHFFTEVERFERHLDRLRRDGEGVDYVSVCSPNYLHDAHCRLALRNDAHAICEKPVVVNPRNLDLLLALEKDTGKRIYPVHQLRLSEKLQTFRESILTAPQPPSMGTLTYITPRGQWYDWSWKGDANRSGGILANIGIHMLDALCWIFGEHQSVSIGSLTTREAMGVVVFKDTVIDFLLSIDRKYLPYPTQQSHRELTLHFPDTSTDSCWSGKGTRLEFSSGFTDLHKAVYANVVASDEPYMRLSDLGPVTSLLADLRERA